MIAPRGPQFPGDGKRAAVELLARYYLQNWLMPPVFQIVPLWRKGHRRRSSVMRRVGALEAELAKPENGWGRCIGRLIYLKLRCTDEEFKHDPQLDSDFAGALDRDNHNNENRLCFASSGIPKYPQTYMIPRAEQDFKIVYGDGGFN